MKDDGKTEQLPTEIAPGDRLLTAEEFQNLADVPPEVERFANLSNPHTGACKVVGGLCIFER